MDYTYTVSRIKGKEHLWQVQVFSENGTLIGETACLDFESVLECLRMIRGSPGAFVEEAV